jgi:hypothetical protein
VDGEDPAGLGLRAALAQRAAGASFLELSLALAALEGPAEGDGVSGRAGGVDVEVVGG